MLSPGLRVTPERLLVPSQEHISLRDTQSVFAEISPDLRPGLQGRN
jgi:hypothetical protein